MRILIANEGRQGAGGVETYLSSLVPHLESRGHAVALLYANPSSETGPTRVVTNEAWSVSDLGLDEAIAAVRGWHPDVCFSHNMGRLDVDGRLATSWPTFKMMHGYFGTCVSGHKAFAFPSPEPCTRVCGIGCLAYYLPRHCGQLRAGLMMEQYAWARRQQDLFGEYADDLRLLVLGEIANVVGGFDVRLVASGDHIAKVQPQCATSLIK